MRLSEAIKEPYATEPKSYRLSDAMREVPYEIPSQEDLRDKGVGENLVEGAVEAFSSAPQVAGTFIMAYGDYVRKSADKADKQGLIFGIKPIWNATPLGQRIFEAGQKISDANEKYINEKFPEQKNFTFADKFARGVGQGAVSLASAIGMGLVAGPIAPAIAFGGMAGASGMVEAGEKGKPLKEAMQIGGLLGFTEGGLEFWGVNRFLKIKGGSLRKLVANTVNGMVTEFSQEFAQTGAEGMIKTATGLREFKGKESIVNILKDSLFSGAVGAVLGGGGGVTMSLTQRKSVEDSLVAVGIEQEKAEEISDELMKNTIEDVATAVETMPELGEAMTDAEGNVIPVVKKTTDAEQAIADELDKPTHEQIKKKKSGLSLIDEKIQAINDKKILAEQAKEALDWIKSQQKEFSKRIAPHKDGSLAEEYAEIPNKYKNKEGIPPDEAASELGISEIELAEYLHNLDSQADRLKDTIYYGKTKTTRVSEISALKKKASAILQGMREGSIESKKEIKGFQKELIDIIKELDIEAKDKAKFLTSIKNANSPTLLEKEISKVYDRAVKFAEATEKRATKATIEKELKYTKPVKQGSKVKGKYEYSDNKTFQEFREINKLNKENAQSTLDAMDVEGLDEASLIKKRLLSYKANGMSGSVELHKQVLADIRKMKYLGKLAKNEQDFLDRVNKSEKATEVSNAISSIEADKNTFITKFGNMYRRGFGNIYSVLNSIAGKKVAENLDPEKHESDKIVAIDKKTRELTKNIQEILGLKHPDMILQEFQDRAEEKYTIVDVQGLEHEINKMDIMDIYNSVKNDLIRERYYNAFGQEQVNSLLDELSPKEIQIADMLQETLQSYFPILNERSIETTGIDLGSVDNYWPATSERKVDLIDDYKSQGETPSAMQARSNSSKIFPIPKNAWTKTMRGISQAEHVDNLSREFLELKEIFSNRKVKNQIINKFGEDVYNTLMDQIENISLNKATNQSDAVSSAIGKMVNNWVTAKIAVPNINVFAKQLLSVINYSEKMPVGKWAGGFFKGLASPKATFDFMWKNSDGFLEQRFNRGYSEAIQEALEGANKISKNKYSWTKGLSSFVRAGDIAAIVYGGYPLVQAELAKGKSIQEAFATFKDSTLKSQQSALSSSRSQWQNNVNPVSRLFLAFKNTANQYFRKQVDAIISYNNGDISIKQLAKVTTIYSIINPILYAGTGKAVAMGMRALGATLFGAVHDDEEDAESIMMDLLIQVLINPFMAVPILDDMSKFAARTVLGKSTWGVFNTPMLDDLSMAMQNMSKDYISLEDYFETFGTVAEVTTGAPVKTSIRMYKLLAGE